MSKRYYWTMEQVPFVVQRLIGEWEDWVMRKVLRWTLKCFTSVELLGNRILLEPVTEA